MVAINVSSIEYWKRPFIFFYLYKHGIRGTPIVKRVTPLLLKTANIIVIYQF
jgi:hypothetical protein